MPSYNSTHTGIQIDNAVDTYQTQSQVQALINSAIETAVAQTKLAMYPIGSIYMSLQNTNPSAFIGGTWQQIKDTFILAAGDTYTAGDISGKATHTHTTIETTTGSHILTVNEMPSHRHATSNYNGGGNSAGHATTNAYPHGDRNYWNYNNPGYSSYTGGGQGHTHTQVSTTTSSESNMPPYLVAYVWKRIA